MPPRCSTNPRTRETTPGANEETIASTIYSASRPSGISQLSWRKDGKESEEVASRRSGNGEGDHRQDSALEGPGIGARSGSRSGFTLPTPHHRKFILLRPGTSFIECFSDFPWSAPARFLPWVGEGGAVQSIRDKPFRGLPERPGCRASRGTQPAGQSGGGASAPGSIRSVGALELRVMMKNRQARAFLRTP